MDRNYGIRHATEADLPQIEEIYACARTFMENNGNPNQWGKTNPPTEQLVQDIFERKLYVIEAGRIHGVFFFSVGEDPTYAIIEAGSWCSEEPYGTIHRIAGDGSGGIVAAAVAFAKDKIQHLRIDTHEDNKVMQHVVEKIGFTRRGIIYVGDGTPRIAYEMI